jgi:2-iminobutanoate/2-iminopropanoate deaminase
MAREIIRTDAAPSSPLYSQGVKTGETIYVAGMAGIDPATGEPAGPTIQEQTRRAIANCVSVLAAGGASAEDIVEVGVLIADPEDFAGMNEVYAETFAVDPPTRYVARLGPTLPGVRVSVRMTASLGRSNP